MNKSRTADYPLVIIGAGAAGLGASEQASKLSIPHIVLEASHRIGGRGLTEYLEGEIAVDLGCHWMHQASMNPYVAWAEKFKFGYDKGGYDYRMFFNGTWLGEDECVEFEAFRNRCYENMAELYKSDPGTSIYEAVDENSKWAAFAHYWLSLMHSNDPDQVAVSDAIEDNDTHEDWPVRDGYGALIAQQGDACPVQLNTVVEKIDWSSSPVLLHTNDGIVSSDHVVITVSTGVLGADQIEFTPELPIEKQEAIHALPLGNSNYQFFSMEKEALLDAPENLYYHDGEVSMALRVRPFDSPCLFTSTGGRFAWWLEKQGTEASRDYLQSALVSIFGSDVLSSLREFKVSAWGYDPWIRGAYSSQLPGKSGQRKVLARPVNECLHFAGEATYPDFVNTAHGAYLSGHRAVQECSITV